MNAQCKRCGSELVASWRYCPNCGVSPAHETTHETTPRETPAEIEKAPVQGAFSGLLFGAVAAPIMIIVGTLLCLTGLGAFLGVPLIIGAILAPLLGPMIGIGELKGKCPWCGAAVSNILKSPGFNCHACGKRIAIQNQKLVKAD